MDPDVIRAIKQRALDLDRGPPPTTRKRPPSNGWSGIAQGRS